MVLSILTLVWLQQAGGDKVEMAPILLQKGIMQVALYGMGGLPDDKWNDILEDVSRKVHFQQRGVNKWVNIFALHQNRHAGKRYEKFAGMIPKWMDLIVFGHEHECMINLTKSNNHTFYVSQPGSAVATSLTDGESIQKHVGFLDVRGSELRMTKVPLVQVRAMVLGEVRLSGHWIDPEDPHIEVAVANFLGDEVKKLVHQAEEKRQELLSDAKHEGNDPERQVVSSFKCRVFRLSRTQYSETWCAFRGRGRQSFGYSSISPEEGCELKGRCASKKGEKSARYTNDP